MKPPIQSAIQLQHVRSICALRISGAVLLTLALAGCLGDDDSNVASAPTPAPSQTVMCKDYDGIDVPVKPKTITVHNNSAGTIYPVLATSKNSVNEWVQGCFQDTTQQYPTEHVYKLYVNEGKGIPPKSSVTITLPLYSKLAENSYITWWNGGRVVLANRVERLLGDEDTSMATPDTVTCQGQNTECALSTYSSPVQFPENIYAQLSEYTFGDSIEADLKGKRTRLLKPENVGYNISYVDHVYMPVAMGPKNNPYIGYSGSTQGLADFKNQLGLFLADPKGTGWPVYNLEDVKLPGGYNIFAQRDGVLPAKDNVPVKPDGASPPVLTVLKCINGQCTEEEKKTLRYGEAVQRMQNLWGACIPWPGEDLVAKKYVNDTVCPAAPGSDLVKNLEAVRQFFAENHRKYLAEYVGKCKGPTPEVPTFTYWEAIKHIYGWVPFNEGCGAGDNKLADTSIPNWDHAKIQSMYIHDLQYNHQQAAVKADNRLLFNPYVELIHDNLKMNAYGFSVDDAVGFMSELGDGIIFAVGGSDGLENPQQFSYSDGFSLKVGVPQSLDGKINKPLLKKYGVCALNQEANDLNCEKDKQDVIMPDNSQIAGFRVGTVPSYPIRVRFTDLDDNVYVLRVEAKFVTCPTGTDPKLCPSNRNELVNASTCSVTDKAGKTHARSEDWCRGADPNQQAEKQLTKNYLSFPSPVNYM
jgi:hypothetical protein